MNVYDVYSGILFSMYYDSWKHFMEHNYYLANSNIGLFFHKKLCHAHTDSPALAILVFRINWFRVSLIIWLTDWQADWLTNRLTELFLTGLQSDLITHPLIRPLNHSITYIIMIIVQLLYWLRRISYLIWYIHTFTLEST